jgi:uncharacterized protein YjbJ (UPF0337 family)
MTWDAMAQNWDEGRTKVRRRWGRLTDEDLRRINGKRTELVSVVSERYGIESDQAEEQIEDFEQSDEFETTAQDRDESVASSPRSSTRDASHETTGKSKDEEDEALNQR